MIAPRDEDDRRRRAGVASESDLLERSLVRRVLSRRRYSRVLEAGSGTGRLSDVLAEGVVRFCGVDIDGRALLVARADSPASVARSLIRSDVGRLPFGDGSFDLVVMVRMYHRLRAPTDVLLEVRRVLRPAGHLLVSTHPRPSLRTLYQDLGAALSGVDAPSLTFDRRPVVDVGWGTLPGSVETRATTERRLRDAGFTVLERYVTGLEELPFTRHFPVPLLERWSAPRAPPPLSPCLFFLAERSRGASA